MIKPADLDGNRLGLVHRAAEDQDAGEHARHGGAQVRLPEILELRVIATQLFLGGGEVARQELDRR